MNAIFSLSSTRCIRWAGFARIRLSFRCVIDVILLHCVCCTRLIRTRIIVCSVIFHLLLSELTCQAAAAAHPIEFEVSRCRTSQFARCFLPAQTRVWNDLQYTVFDTGKLDGFSGESSQSLVASLSLLFSFSMAQMHVRLRKQFMNNFVFPTCINNNDNNNDSSLRAVRLKKYLL